jgi:CheY-like chemotaxis protein
MGSAQAKRPIGLVVEDDFLIRMNAAGMIEDAGFEVIEAANADEAIVILEARFDIRVVFTAVDFSQFEGGFQEALP